MSTEKRENFEEKKDAAAIVKMVREIAALIFADATRLFSPQCNWGKS